MATAKQIRYPRAMACLALILAAVRVANWRHHSLTSISLPITGGGEGGLHKAR